MHGEHVQRLCSRVSCHDVTWPNGLGGHSLAHMYVRTHLTSVGKSSDAKKYATTKAAVMKHFPQMAKPTLTRRAISCRAKPVRILDTRKLHMRQAPLMNSVREKATRRPNLPAEEVQG